MRYLQAVERDGRYHTTLLTRDIPTPAAGETLVRVAASGINRADLSQIAGRYPPPPGESDILGLEVSGWIADSGVPVCALLGGGGHAEYVAAPTGQVFPAPCSIDLVAAAGIPEAYLTAFVNLVVEAGLTTGATALIHAGASGVGIAAIHMAKLVGARVVATTRTTAKLPALAAAGADLALAIGDDDPVAVIERAWGLDVVDVVLDPVGAPTLSADLRLLAVGGRVIVISTMGGARPELDLSLLMKKRGRIVGSTLRSRSRAEKAALVERFRNEILPAFDGGRFVVTVDGVFPPERAAEALQRMRENRNVGKLLIQWESSPHFGAHS